MQFIGWGSERHRIEALHKDAKDVWTHLQCKFVTNLVALWEGPLAASREHDKRFDLFAQFDSLLVHKASAAKGDQPFHDKDLRTFCKQSKCGISTLCIVIVRVMHMFKNP